MKALKSEDKFWSPVITILVFCFTLSLLTFIVYSTEAGFPDETMFFLLAVLRYSSFLVCVCSLFLLAVCVARVIRKPSVSSIVGIIVFLFCALYGACIIIIDAFIISITGGNA